MRISHFNSNSKCERLSGVKFDHKLTFDGHISYYDESDTLYELIKEAYSHERIFYIAIFSFCPLIWMCCSRIKNRKINSLHKRMEL